MTYNTKKYSLVAYLVDDALNDVRALQQELSELTGSTKCLTDWLPHITLGDGPEIFSDEQLRTLETQLKNFAYRQNPIIANVSGFGGIENWKGALDGKITPYVLWLNVDVSPALQQAYDELRDTVTAHYPTWLPRSEHYAPHVTLAFADLTKDGYTKGLEFLTNRSLITQFTISHIALVECYGVGNMTSKEYRRFTFSTQ